MPARLSGPAWPERRASAVLLDELVNACERELTSPYEVRLLCYRDPKTGITYACEISLVDNPIVWTFSAVRGATIRDAHGKFAVWCETHNRRLTR